MCSNDVPRTGEPLLFAQSMRAGRRPFETSCQACTTKWRRSTITAMAFTPWHPRHHHRPPTRSLIEHLPMLPTTSRAQTPHAQEHHIPDRWTNSNEDTTTFLWTAAEGIQAEMSPRPTRRPACHKSGKRSPNFLLHRQWINIKKKTALRQEKKRKRYATRRTTSTPPRPISVVAFLLATKKGDGPREDWYQNYKSHRPKLLSGMKAYSFLRAAESCRYYIQSRMYFESRVGVVRISSLASEASVFSSQRQTRWLVELGLPS